AKGIGQKTTIAVAADTGEGLALSASAVIVPVQIDLYLSSDSYTPPFYRGRALPTSGTNVRAEAIPHLATAGGAEVPSSDIIVTWRKDGQVIADVSGKGRTSALFPLNFGIGTISVEAQVLDGSLSGEASQRVPQADPQLVLYEDHPLYGLTYFAALAPTSFVP